MEQELEYAEDRPLEVVGNEELERRFDDGEDITNFMDASTLRRPNQERYARIFPKSEEELDAMLATSGATPRSECMTMEEGKADIKERMGW